MAKRISWTVRVTLIPLLVSALLAIMFLFPSWRMTERRIYDLFLRILPTVEESPSVLLLNIDDPAIAQVGIWPWSRDLVADGLLLLREFNAATTVLDIEYVDKSPRGVDSRYMENTLPTLFQEEFSGLKGNTEGLLSAISKGNIPARDALEYSQALGDLTDTIERDLMDAVSRISRDNDVWLGTAARMNGSTFFTVNMLNDNVRLYHVSDELLAYVGEHIPVNIKNLNRKNKTPFPSSPATQPAILPVISGGRGAGFPNVVVDDDGVRRRINLFIENEGKYYPQLALRPLLAFLGEPSVTLSGNTIILEKAQLPDGTIKDIRIPLCDDGRLLINWPHKTFNESFRKLSFKTLIVHDLLLANLVRNLGIMDEAGYFATADGSGTSPLAIYRQAELLKTDMIEGTRDPSEMDEFAKLRNLFVQETASWLEGTAEQTILAQIDRILSQDGLDEASRAEYTEIRTQVADTFSTVRSDLKQLKETRDTLSAAIPNSFIIIGLTGISTFDTGVNPFEKNYMNVGTHAAVANTILTQSFLQEIPDWVSIIAAFVLSLALTVTIAKKDPKRGIIWGSLTMGALVLLSAISFVVFRIYMPVIAPVIATGLSALTISIIKFVHSETEKRFLRSAFSRYLSSDVINQLIKDPDKLNLGGEKKTLSVIFTDIKGFSTISEKLDPVQLVQLLNEYLTEMSDIILEEKGTIDKYEGDAIISFFGAPIETKDHAYRACLSAVRMHRGEKLLNTRLMAEGRLISPLMTRIGINTGEMVVGNMGTTRKMDYTVMGSSVNLASRLEGVNKQYGTWVLASETTIQSAGDSFLTRKLDRVRVIGIDTPVRLYEILEEKSEADAQMLEWLPIFHAALDLFEAKSWDEAEQLFNKVLALFPEDGPSKAFIARCIEYRKKAPAATWDGVFNLVSK